MAIFWVVLGSLAVGFLVFWGVHYLPPFEFEGVTPKVEKEPWELLPDRNDFLDVTVTQLWRLANDAELERMAIREGDRTQAIAEDIAENGLKQPIVLSVDDMATCAITDGRHRIWIGQQFGRETLPVRIEKVPHLKLATKIPITDFLLEYARSKNC